LLLIRGGHGCDNTRHKQERAKAEEPAPHSEYRFIDRRQRGKWRRSPRRRALQ
jgi:hypothetical protein